MLKTPEIVPFRLTRDVIDGMVYILFLINQRAVVYF